MSNASRRPRSRPRPRPGIEALEDRMLLANAGSLDPGFGAGRGYATAPTGVPVSSFTNPGTFPFPEGYNASADSVNALPNGNVLVTGTISYANGAGGTSAALSVDELNADGSPDTSFGKGGQVQFSIGVTPSDFGSQTIQSFRVAVDSSGRILLASNATDGGGNPTYLVARLTASGVFDPTFGTGGVAEYPASTTTPVADRMDEVVSVLPQANNQVIVAGGTGGGFGTTANGFSAVRLNADGSLDTTFGTAGTSYVSIPGIQSGSIRPTGAAMQANGQVVVTGTFINEGGGTNLVPITEFAVIRLNADGSQDVSFGGASTASPGIEVIPPSLSNASLGGDSTSFAVAVDPTTGKILVTGSDHIQHNPSEISPTVPALYRLNTDGTLDTTFGTGGMLTPNFHYVTPPPGYSTLIKLAVQADGSILLTGVAPYTAANFTRLDKLEVLRLTSDGTPDATFGNTSTPGMLLTNLTSDATQTPAILASNGDILVVGTATVPSPSALTYGFTVDRLLPSAPTGPVATHPPIPPSDFTGMGYSNPAVYDPTDAGFHYYPSNVAGLTNLVGNDYYYYGPAGLGQSIPAPADYLGVGFDQYAVYLPNTGVYAIQATATSPAVALPLGPAGAGQSIPAPADYYHTGQADIAVYITQTGTFAIKDPSGKTPGFTVAFGIAGKGQSIPAPADYFGQGQADLAVYLTQAGEYAIRNPVTNQDFIIPFGKPGAGNSVPVPGDYTGSGAVELAVYIPSAGVYIYRPSANAPKDVIVPIGTANSGEVAAPGDYDGSGRMEAAIYDPSGGFIEYQPANGGPVVTIHVGKPNDGSVAVATPSGALAEFSSPPSFGSAIRPGAVAASSPAPASSVSANAITLTKASAVPAGPTLASASIRVPRTLVNQAAPDPLETA